MSSYYLDSSALAKRYLTEVGSTWIIGLTDPTAGHQILVAGIALVEVAAALAARHRAQNGISLQERDRAITLIRRHFATAYAVSGTDRLTLDVATELTQRQRLRGYDAVQLATALAASAALRTAGLPNLTFVAADADLLAAAHAEGLATIDQNLHR